MRTAIVSGQLSLVGEILHEGWQVKKSLASRVSNERIDGIYEAALRAGATGGKLLGAGVGGFMLFYCEPQFQSAVRREPA